MMSEEGGFFKVVLANQGEDMGVKVEVEAKECRDVLWDCYCRC